MPNGFIFGGNTGETAESLRRKRDLAEALLARNQGRVASSLSEGLAQFGSVLGARIRLNQGNKGIEQGRARASDTLAGFFDQPSGRAPTPKTNIVDSFTSSKGLTGNKKQPRGLRNNNPGNIEFGKFTKSRGATGSDGRFARFNGPEQGISAMGDLLRSYQRRGLTTVRQMINRWAPPSENDTGSYARRVAAGMGIDPDQPFDFSGNPELASRMVAGMIQHENGQQPFSQETIAAGLGGGVAAPSVAQAAAAPSIGPDRSPASILPPPQIAQNVPQAAEPVVSPTSAVASALLPQPQPQPQRNGGFPNRLGLPGTLRIDEEDFQGFPSNSNIAQPSISSAPITSPQGAALARRAGLAPGVGQETSVQSVSVSSGNEQDPQNNQFAGPLPGASNEQLIAYLSEPFANRELKATVLQELKRRSTPPDPLKDLQRQKLQRDLDAPPERETAKDANNRLRFLDDGALVFPDLETQPKSRVLSPDEVKTLGLPPGAYQQKADGTVSQIGKGSTNLVIGPDGKVTFQQGTGLRSLTESQSKDTVFATRAAGSLPILDELGDALTSLPEKIGGSFPVVGNFAKSEKF